MKKSNSAVIRDLKRELVILQKQHLQLLDVAKKLKEQLDGKDFANAKRNVGQL